MPTVNNKDEEDVVATRGYEEIHSWHVLTIEETVTRLRANEDLVDFGLSTAEAEKRLQQYGPNKLSEKQKTTMLARIWRQMSDLLMCILVVALLRTVFVTALNGLSTQDAEQRIISWITVGLLCVILIVNTYIGVARSFAAEATAGALKNMLSSDAKVIRDGKETTISAANLVPGDVVILSQGDVIPADLRLIRVSNLVSSEAALTGESSPIEKRIEPIEVPEAASPEDIPLCDRKNLCFSATHIVQGSGVGIVIETGDKTHIGSINTLVNAAEEKMTDVEEQIQRLSKLLSYFIIIFMILTFLVAFFITHASLMNAVAIGFLAALAMIPEGLVPILFMVYAHSASQLLKNNAIIRYLPIVESLGSITMICSDTIGTLTQNRMSLVAFVTSRCTLKNNPDPSIRSSTNFVWDDETDAPSFKEESPAQEFILSALAGGILCNKSVLGKDGEREGDAGDPIELSILRSAYFAGIDIDAIKKDYPIVAEVPYSLYYKFMATIHEPSESIGVSELTGKYIVYAKGDPERMVELCSDQATGDNLKVLEPFDKSFWLKQVAILSSRGHRILALCRAVVSKTEIQLGEQLGPNFLDRQGNVWMTMVGLCAVVDPPRQECIQAIAEVRGAGIRVAMITGDTKDTAVAIGNIIGLVDEECSSAITGPEMDVMSEEELEKSVMSNNVFALASPQNKIQIVEALQAQGQVCGMTGNGVNDAPALKAADIGIAMGLDGTDVAREAADMILVDDSYPTIVMAIKGGRVVWENLRKILLINIPINLSQGFSVLFGLLVGLPMPPLNVIQILYSNLICAMALSFVCAVEPAEEGIMNLPPRRVGKSLLGRYLSLRIAIATTAMTVFIVLSVYWLRSLGLEKYDQLAQYAVAFNVLNFGAVSIMLSARFAHNSSFSTRIFVGNKWCWIVVLIYAILQLGCTYIPGLNSVVFQMSPMDGIQWGITIFFTVSMFIIMEVEKLIRLNVLHQKGRITDDDAEKWIFDVSNRKRKKPSQVNPREVRQLGLRGSIR